jgi:GNAT superfamily N-acetyltransferase
MAGALTVKFEPEPTSADLASLSRGLVAWNSAHGPPERWRRVTFFLRAADGTICGGLDGNTYWDWLFVRQLWVDPAHQRSGHGTALMLAAEREAKSRGCQKAHLDTFDFQALPFYQKLGYSIFGTLGEFPSGHTRYFLMKGEL